MLVELHNSVWDNLGQNKPDFRSNHDPRHPEYINLNLSRKEDRVRPRLRIGNKKSSFMLVKLDKRF